MRERGPFAPAVEVTPSGSQLGEPRVSLCVALVVALAMSLFVAPVMPQEFHPWFPAVGDGTPILEFAAVPLDERGEAAVSIIEDLVIRPRGGDPDYLFYRPLGVAVDGLGRMFVLDAGNHRIQVYDHKGEFLRTLGSRGQGPGELDRPHAIAVVNDRVVVYDFGNARLGIWSVEGEHLEDRSLGVRAIVREMAGTADGELALTHTTLNRQTAATTWTISRLSLTDGETVQLLELPVATRPDEPSRRIPIDVVVPALAVDESTIYISTTAQYQVVALGESGEAKWALRVPWKRLPYPEFLVELALERRRRGRPDVKRAELLIPDSLRALAGVQVDGHGHLYVFLQTDIRSMEDLPDGTQESGLPVDVYSRKGERVLAGIVTGGFIWDAAYEDFVYGVRTDPDTQETMVVRYRLLESF